MNNSDAVKKIGELINQSNEIKDCEGDWQRLCHWRKCVMMSMDAIFADAKDKKSEFGGIQYGLGSMPQYVKDDGAAQAAFEGGLQKAREYLLELRNKLNSVEDDSVRWDV